MMLAFLVAGAIANGAPSAFTINDDVANRRFVLEFHNLGRRSLCLSPAMWPNEHGSISLTSAKISVSIGLEDFPLDTFIEDFGTDLVKVKPRRGARAYLSYAAFKIPGTLAPKAKVLHLRPAAVVCD
jgi:hypothetical protein